MLAAAQGAEETHVAAVLAPNEALNHPFVTGLKKLGIPVTPVVVGARSYLKEYRSLRALVAQLQPMIVHTHGYHADLIGGAVTRAHRLPAVSTVHGFLGVPLRNQVYERMQLIALRHVDAALAVSRPLVDRLAKAGVASDKIHFVPNGYTPVAPNLTRDAARQKLGLTGSAPIAGWVGRLSREKGADVILDAIAACKPPWHLSMIGDGPERERLRKRAADLGISDRVTWHGSVPSAGTLFCAFDAFVLSSRTEGTPIVLFEAMHSDVPIVATRVGGVPDVVSSAEALLVPTEEPAMIASALWELLSEPAATKQRSLLARERVIRDFGVNAWAASINDIYRSIESSRSTRGIDVEARESAIEGR
jgi:glycosyltransferase involved in cell wall biosynthesis